MYDTLYYTDNILYSNSQSFLLQERGNENIENPVYIDEPNFFEGLTLQFPLVSSNYVIKLVADYLSGYDQPREVFISSPYNSHKVPNMKGNFNGFEWFSPDDKHKIIMVDNDTSENIVKISLCNTSGRVIQKQQIKTYYDYYSIKASQNGRYLLIYEFESGESQILKWKIIKISYRKINESDSVYISSLDIYNLLSEETKEGDNIKKDNIEKSMVFEVKEVKTGKIEVPNDHGGLEYDVKVDVLNNGDMVALH